MADFNDTLALNRELRGIFDSLFTWQTKNRDIALNSLDSLDSPDIFRGIMASGDAALEAMKHLIAAQDAMRDTMRAINASQREAAR